MAPETEEIFLGYNWPGNVRQLQNVIHNIVVLNDEQQVTPNMLPAPLDEIPKTHLNYIKKNSQTTRYQIKSVNSITSSLKNAETFPKKIIPLWQVEKEAIERAVKLCNGNIAKAAGMLDVSPSTIYRKRLNWEAKTDTDGKATTP